MNQFYTMLGTSRQNVSQQLRRVEDKTAARQLVLNLARDIRKDHRRMGCRKMYWKSFNKMPLGRDQCESIMLENGLRVRFPRNFRRTTYSIGKHFYPNRIEGLTLNDVNQVWQTDITYVEVGNRFYYVVFIMDVYSRRIVGWSVDYSLWAQANIRALREAIELRGGGKLPGLIHHSDRGSQYIDKDYVSELGKYEITPSMCKHGWQNAYCERINGTIKNEYLRTWDIVGYSELKLYLDRAVNLYNNDRPHDNLPNRMAPAVFEAKLEQLFRIKPTMTLYSGKSDT